MKTYSIRIIPIINEETRTGGRNDAPFHISLTTDNIDWTMGQWGRNRPPFNYEILEVKDAQDN